MEAKHIEDSCVTLSQLMGPQDTNTLGNVHGGVIMKMVDVAGALAAMRHARHPVVTVVMDSMTFMEPIRVGMFVQCNAELSYVGRSSIEVRVEVVAENPMIGTSSVTNTAYLVYVALDSEGNPTPVPPLIYDTEERRQRAADAEERQRLRKEQRKREERIR